MEMAADPGVASCLGVFDETLARVNAAAVNLLLHMQGTIIDIEYS